MELKVFNRELNLIGIVDSFSNLIWNRKYNSIGEFQLNILFTEEINSLLKFDNIIYKDEGQAGFITSKEIKIDDNGADIIEVKGKFIIGYLERRIIWGCEEINSNVVEAAHQLIINNCIECIGERKIPNLVLEYNKEISIPLIMQVSYDNLFDTLSSIAKVHELGLTVDFDIFNKKLIFKIYKGIDRSISQSKVAPVIFSREFENILGQNYIESNSNLKNVALVSGTGEGIERKVITIGEECGLDRYELFVDARDISDTRQIENTDGTVYEEIISDEEYSKLLITRGNEKLAEHYRIKCFDSTLNTNSNMEYKKDYDLGDIITFFDKKWDVKVDTRITEICEIYDNEGLSLNVTFGKNAPTLIDIIKRR